MAQSDAFWNNNAGSFSWRTNGNWAALAYPNAPDVTARFGWLSNAVGGTSAAFDQSRIAITNSGSLYPDIPGTVDLAAIILDDTNLISRWFRNSTGGSVTASTFGQVTLHGTPVELGGETVNLLLGNYSVTSEFIAQVDLRFYMNASDQILNLRLAKSGVFHTEHAHTRIVITVPIVEMDEPVTITKTGPGTLQYNIDYSATPGRNETTGGLIVAGGTIEGGISSSALPDAGGVNTSPWGKGPLTLRDGVTIRGWSTNNPPAGRTFHNAVILEGGHLTMGSDTVPNAMGSVTISGVAGNTGTLLGDLTINALSTSAFSQSLAGDFRITKTGPARLSFSGDNNTFRAVTIREGGDLTFSGSSGSLPQIQSTLLADQFVIDGGTLRFAGFGTTLGSNRGMQFSEKGATIEVIGTWLMGTSGPMDDIDPENPGPFRKTGTGTWTLSSSSVSPYRGPTEVSAGRLFVNGVVENSTIDVLSGATVGGAGVFGRELTVRSGANFVAGARTEVGVSHALAPITIEAGATATFRIDGANSSSRLAAYQGMALDGVILDINLLYQPLGAEAFVLVENRGAADSLTGVFLRNGVPLNEGDTFTVTQVIDASAPEPAYYSHEFRITYAYNGGGYQDSIAIIAAGEAPVSGYDSWRAARFGSANDPAGDPLAQPVGQAVANLMFYALGLDLAADPAVGLPKATGAPAISFTRRVDSGVRLVVEATSGNPSGPWEEIAVLDAGATSWTGSANVVEAAPAGGTVAVTVTDTAAGAATVRLVRVRAVLP